MAAASGAGEAGAITRLTREVTLVNRAPVPGVKFTPGGDTNPLEWTLQIDAPDNYVANGASRPNPYAGRSFTVAVKYPATYPFKHPEPKFKPGSLFHPNVNKETGEVCGELFADWGPTKNSTDVAKTIVKFLGEPNLSHPVDVECAAMLATDVAKYETEARKLAAALPKK